MFRSRPDTGASARVSHSDPLRGREVAGTTRITVGSDGTPSVHASGAVAVAASGFAYPARQVVSAAGAGAPTNFSAAGLPIQHGWNNPSFSTPKGVSAADGNFGFDDSMVTFSNDQITATITVAFRKAEPKDDPKENVLVANKPIIAYSRFAPLVHTVTRSERDEGRDVSFARRLTYNNGAAADDAFSAVHPDMPGVHVPRVTSLERVNAFSAFELFNMFHTIHDATKCLRALVDNVEDGDVTAASNAAVRDVTDQAAHRARTAGRTGDDVTQAVRDAMPAADRAGMVAAMEAMSGIDAGFLTVVTKTGHPDARFRAAVHPADEDTFKALEALATSPANPPKFKGALYYLPIFHEMVEGVKDDASSRNIWASRPTCLAAILVRTRPQLKCLGVARAVSSGATDRIGVLDAVPRPEDGGSRKYGISSTVWNRTTASKDDVARTGVAVANITSLLDEWGTLSNAHSIGYGCFCVPPTPGVKKLALGRLADMSPDATDFAVVLRESAATDYGDSGADLADVWIDEIVDGVRTDAPAGATHAAIGKLVSSKIQLSLDAVFVNPLSLLPMWLPAPTCGAGSGTAVAYAAGMDLPIGGAWSSSSSAKRVEVHENSIKAYVDAAELFDAMHTMPIAKCMERPESVAGEAYGVRIDNVINNDLSTGPGGYASGVRSSGTSMFKLNVGSHRAIQAVLTPGLGAIGQIASLLRCVATDRHTTIMVDAPARRTGLSARAAFGAAAGGAGGAGAGAGAGSRPALTAGRGSGSGSGSGRGRRTGRSHRSRSGRSRRSATGDGAGDDPNPKTVPEIGLTGPTRIKGGRVSGDPMDEDF